MPIFPSNVCFDFEYGDAAKTAELIEGAAHVARVVLESPRVAPNPMEPRAALAWYDAERDTFELRVRASGRLCDARRARGHHERARRRKSACNLVDVGGAFGARTAPFSEYPLMLLHGQAARPSDQVALDPLGGFPHRQPWPRHPARGRARARRLRPLHRVAHQLALRFRRLPHAGRRLHQLVQRHDHRRQRLPGGGALRPPSPAHDQYRADQCLSRRRPPGSGLHRRAAGRRRRRHARHRSAGDAPAQRHPPHPDAVQDRDRRGVRQRRFRRAHRQGEGGLALGELRAAPARGGAPRRAARHRLLGVPGAVRRRPGAEGPGRHPLRRGQPDRALQRGRTERAGPRDRVSRAGRRRARHRPHADRRCAPAIPTGRR